jgi:hypothetical protein
VEAETIDFCMKYDTDVTRDMFDIDELISSHLNFSFSTFYLDRIHSSIISPHQICVFVEVSTPW